MYARLQTWVQKYYFPLYLAVGGLLVFLACFLAPVRWVAWGVIIAGSVFLTPEQIMGIYIISRGFFGVLPQTALMRLALLGLLAVYYLCRLIKNQQKINWRLAVPVALFVLYLLLPVHTVSLKSWVIYSLDFVFLYLVYELRDIVHLKSIVLLLGYSLLFSVLCAWLAKVPGERLSNAISVDYRDSYLRVTGLFTHSNLLSLYAILSLTGLCILQYLQKIHWAHFLALFTAIFLVTYFSFSKNFILGALVLLFFFSIIMLVRYRAQAFRTLLPLAAVLLAIVLILLPQTKIYLNAQNYDVMNYEWRQHKPITDEFGEVDKVAETQWWADVYAGKAYYDPGRGGLWKLYWQDYTSSAKVIFLGRGVNRPAIGQMFTAHNILLQFLWYHGLVGVVLLGAIFAGLIDWRSLKQKGLWSKILVAVTMILVTVSVFVMEAPRCYFLMFVVLMVLALRETPLQPSEAATASKTVGAGNGLVAEKK